MSKRELASILCAINSTVCYRGIFIINAPSSVAWLELRSKPADLEWDLTQLTGDLQRKINDKSLRVLFILAIWYGSYLVVTHFEEVALVCVLLFFKRKKKVSGNRQSSQSFVLVYCVLTQQRSAKQAAMERKSLADDISLDSSACIPRVKAELDSGAYLLSFSP